MKRKTAMALAAVFAMSVAGTALAAPVNPFSDVPANHWAYDSVSKLAQAGVISGYGDGAYKGEKTMTRYEMAAIIGKALANSDQADAELQQELDALQAEFSAELYNLGVRVDNLESKVSNIKFTGEVRSRYDYQENVSGDSSDNNYRTRLRIFMEAPVADNVTFHGRYHAESGWGSSGDSKLDRAYIAGDLGGLEYRFGRQPLWLGQGLLADVSNNDGLFLGGGKEVKVFAGVFKRDNKAYNFDKKLAASEDEKVIASDEYKANEKRLNDNLNYYAANIDAKVNKSLAVSLSYLQDKDSDFYKTYSAGLEFTGIKNFTVSGEYGENDSDYAKLAEVNNDKAQAWVAKVQYKGAQKSKVGSYGIWVGYRDAEQGFDPAVLTTIDGGNISKDWGKADNIKGTEFGFDYTVFKNGIFKVQYGDFELKKADAGVDKDKNNFYAQLRYWF
ncbi:MAG: S-layer homology domain-containing protein [Sporomusa sp.]